jgi:hypothetical protein
MARTHLIRSAILGLATGLLVATQPLAALASTPDHQPTPLVQVSGDSADLLNPEVGIIVLGPGRPR